MAESEEKKFEAKHVSFEEIFSNIDSENLPKLSKEKLHYFCNALKLKVSGEKKELVQRLEPLSKCKQLFDKKVARIQEDYKFSTALDPLSIPSPSAKWRVIGKNTDVAVPIVTESTIKEYQKAKYAGGKGQYRKAYRLFSSRRIMSLRAAECSEHSGALGCLETKTCPSSEVDQSVTKQQPSLLKRINYVPVNQCTNDWRALRVGIITASKVPALLGFCGMKEFDTAWFSIRNNIDESVLNPKRSRLPNFIRGKQEESNALAKFCEDSGFNISECGYFKHPKDKRFGASPDGVSTGEVEFLVEIKTRSLQIEVS
ncbi:hypothetical protein ACROYT_G022794 [Oculina patagonica]